MSFLGIHLIAPCGAARRHVQQNEYMPGDIERLFIINKFCNISGRRAGGGAENGGINLRLECRYHQATIAHDRHRVDNNDMRRATRRPVLDGL
jgi:hypothetical protein